jgi:hypothetical protein
MADNEEVPKVLATLTTTGKYSTVGRLNSWASNGAPFDTREMPQNVSSLGMTARCSPAGFTGFQERSEFFHDFRVLEVEVRCLTRIRGEIVELAG